MTFQIEQMITQGTLHVSDRLPSERELSDQFSVSRVVIREAVRNLEARGIVEVRHGSGTYVKSIPSPTLARTLTLLLRLEESSLLDLYVVRQALELVAAPVAALKATPEEISAMRKCHEEMLGLFEQGLASEEAFLAFNTRDEEFHNLISEAAHNLPLATLMNPIIHLIMTGRLEIIRRTGGFQRFIMRSKRETVLDEHFNILAAITNHDPKAAEHFVYTHLQRSLATYRDLE